MKRIINPQLGPDHNGRVNSPVINNQAYLSKNKTSNLEQASVQVRSNIQTQGYQNQQSQQSHTRNASSNVEQEFTDSWILENVNEPQRSKIRQIKTRARSARKSIGNQFIH